MFDFALTLLWVTVVCLVFESSTLNIRERHKKMSSIEIDFGMKAHWDKVYYCTVVGNQSVLVNYSSKLINSIKIKVSMLDLKGWWFCRAWCVW